MGEREGEGEIERREWIDRERGRRGRALAAEGKRGGEDREEGVGLAGLGFGRWGAGWAADGPWRLGLGGPRGRLEPASVPLTYFP